MPKRQIAADLAKMTIFWETLAWNINCRNQIHVWNNFVRISTQINKNKTKYNFPLVLINYNATRLSS